MALDDLRVTDADIEGTIKVAPPGTALDPNKTKGAAHRTLLKKLRDYAEEVAAQITGPAADEYAPIAQNAYGTHPAFPTLNEVLAYLLSEGAVVPLPTPAAPYFTANDTDNSLYLDHATLADSELEYRENGGAWAGYGGTGWPDLGNQSYAAGYFEGRVKAIEGVRNASSIVQSPAFTTPAQASVINPSVASSTSNSITYQWQNPTV